MIFTWVRRLVAWSLFVFLLVPLIGVVMVSFNGGATPMFPPQDLSVRWFWSALQNQRFISGAMVSFWIAVGATAIGTPLGVAAAFGIARSRFPGRGLVELIFLSPLIVPGLVIGVALLVSMSTLGIRDPWLRLLIGHTLIILPYVIRTSLAGLARLEPSLEEAAMTLGASRLTVVRRIVLPALMSPICAGALFGFIISFDDAAVSIFLVSRDVATLPLVIMSYMQYNFDPSIAAVSTLLIIMTLVGALFIERVFGLKRFLGS
jgi:putative spermidine/putrescine transport system permease protein